MDVHCPQCDTLFEFDERQMRGAIATLKCSVCQHLFRIETNIALGREDHRRWMVRNTSSGDVMYFSGFDVLHRWIMEGQLQRSDEISRTGAKWVKLEDIGEFTPVFEVVDSIQSLTRGQGDARERSQTVQQFPSPHAQPVLRSPSRQPAPSWGGAQPAQTPASREGHALHLPPSPHGAALSIAPLNSADSAPSFSPSVRLPPQQSPAREAQRTRTPQALASQPVDAFASTDAIDVPAQALQREAERREAGRFTSGVSESGSPGRLQAERREAGRSASGVSEGGAPPLSDGAYKNQPAPAETWTMHGPATESEPELYRVETTPESSGGFNLVKAVVLLFLICVVAVVSFRFAAPDQFKAVFGGESNLTANESVTTLAEQKPTQREGEPTPASFEEAREEARTGVNAAYDSARAERDAEQGELITQGIVAAMSPLHGAVDTASELSSRVKRGSSVNSTLKEAQSALDSGDSKLAYDLFYKVLDRDARNAKALTGLGWTLIQMGRHESAAVQFKRAMSIDPGYVSAYLGLAKAERNKGNPKGAIRIYDEFLSRFPSSRQANIARTQRDKLLKEIGQ